MNTVKFNKNKVKEKGINTPSPLEDSLSLKAGIEYEPNQETKQNTQNNNPSLNNLPNFSDEQEESQENHHGSLSIDGENGGEESFRPEVEPVKEQQKPKSGKKIRKSTREQTEVPEINIELGKPTGDIEGSDFDNQGNLKKKRKKSKKAPLGGVAVLLLVGVVMFGAYKVASKEPVDTPPEDLSAETPINDPAKDSGQYIPPVLEDPTSYLDDASEDDVDGEEVDESKLTPEEVKQRELDKIYATYLTHDNTYTNLSVKYPSSWYITENVQESFNEIKALSKVGVFSFNTAELEQRINILQFKSPEVENTSVVDILALPSKDFDKTKLLVDFELPNQLVTLQPEQFVTETWGTHKVEVGYFLKQEFNLTYLVVQAYETVGNNILAYTFKEPFFDTADFVAEEESVEEDAEKTEEKEEKLLTIEELNELTPSLKDYKNIVTSVEVK